MATRGGTPATVALDRAGVAYTVRAFRHEAGTNDFGGEAADALGVPPEQVFKTLIASADGELVVAVVPVSGMLDLKALATVVGAKHAALAASEVAQRRTGYVVGAISPIGQKSRLTTVLDASALGFAHILVSGGRRGLDVELDPRDLLSVTGGSTAVIGRA